MTSLRVAFVATSLWALAGFAQASLRREPVAVVAPFQVTIHFETNDPGDTLVTYGKSPGALTHTSRGPGSSLVHSRTLRNLTPGTHYHYRVSSTGPAGTAQSALEQSFVTAAVPPENVLRYDLDEVWALAWHGDRLFAGGTFDRLREVTGSGVVLSSASGLPYANDFPEVVGPVFASAVDARGRLYLAGRLVTVGGLPRTGVVRLLPDHGVDPNFDVIVDGHVFAMSLVGDTLYLGGKFTEVKGVSRSNVAALDVSGDGNASVTGFAPAPNDEVSAMVATSTTVFLGGGFSSVNQVPQTAYFAPVNPLTGQPTPWSAFGPDNAVTSLALNGAKLAVGGLFKAPVESVAVLDVGTRQRQNLAMGSFRQATGAQGLVTSLALTATTLYVGGGFDTVGGAARPTVAAIDTQTGALSTSWNPPLGGVAWALLALPAGDLLVAGQLGLPSGSITAVRVGPTGAISTTWQPAFSRRVWTFASFGGAVFAGGSFSGIDPSGSAPRLNRLAAFDVSTGTHVPLPGVSGAWVGALAASRGVLYVGGYFRSVPWQGDQRRENLAAFDVATSALLPFDPSPNDAVGALLAEPDRLVIGGSFTSVGGQSRRALAAVDLDGGLTSWAPVGVSGQANALARVGPWVAVGGQFTAGGPTNLALVDAWSGALDPFNASLSGWAGWSVWSLAADGDRLYVGGEMRAPYPYLAAVNVSRNQVYPIGTVSSQDVVALAADARTLFVGANEGAWVRRGPLLRRIELADGGESEPVDLGELGPNGMVAALAWDCATGRLAVGGAFNQVNGVAAGGVTVLSGLPCYRTLPDGGIAITDAGGVDAGGSDGGASDGGQRAGLVVRLEPGDAPVSMGSRVTLVATLSARAGDERLHVELQGLAAQGEGPAFEREGADELRLPLFVTGAPGSTAIARLTLESGGLLGAPAEVSVTVREPAVSIPCGCASKGPGAGTLLGAALGVQALRRRRLRPEASP